jgi:hypothetical protein
MPVYEYQGKSYDLSETDPVKAKSKIQSYLGEQVSQKQTKEPSFAEKVDAGLYGAVTGVVGGLGELEKFGAYDLPKMFPEAARQNLATIGVLPETENKPKGRQTIFPTIKEVEKGFEKIGYTPPREEVKCWVV